jgi:hypothetical protein
MTCNAADDRCYAPTPDAAPIVIDGATVDRGGPSDARSAIDAATADRRGGPDAGSTADANGAADAQSTKDAAPVDVTASAKLAFVVGTSSPTPPDPDSYGSGDQNVTHTYTLKNIGGVTTGPITLTLAQSGSYWGLVSPTGSDCVNITQTLAPNATCTIRVIFRAASLTMAGDFTGTLKAQAGTSMATNGLTGSAAYNWVASPATEGTKTYDVTIQPSGACTQNGASELYLVANAPDGTQYNFNATLADSNCTSGTGYFTGPLGIRDCNCASCTTWSPGVFYNKEVCWASPPGVPFWGALLSIANPTSGAVPFSSCDTANIYITTSYYCQ